MQLRILRRAVAAAALATAALGLTTTSPAGAVDWAPADSASIHPGVMMFTEGAQCTANFVYTAGSEVYLGYAAHCAGTGAATDTNGCDSGTLPLGTPVEIDGASRPGTLVYSSWIAMQQAGETDDDACNYNDLALVRIDPADVASVNPSIPFWGGPVALDTDGTGGGETVYSFGNSSLRLGLEPLSPKVGTSLGSGGGWTHPVYTVSPGIPGDSGSALLSSTGEAAGVLSTLAIAPLAGSNNYSDLALALQYMHTHGGPAATLVPGTEAFSPLL